MTSSRAVSYTHLDVYKRQALSGYVLRDGGRGPLAFSILFNHVGGKQDGARHAADKLVELVARYATHH